MVASRVKRLGSVYQIVRKTAVIVPAIAAGCHSCFHPRKASTARTASLHPSMLSRTLLALSPSITFKSAASLQHFYSKKGFQFLLDAGAMLSCRSESSNK